jgi:hypothetical protein
MTAEYSEIRWRMQPVVAHMSHQFRKKRKIKEFFFLLTIFTLQYYFKTGIFQLNASIFYLRYSDVSEK